MYSVHSRVCTALSCFTCHGHVSSMYISTSFRKIGSLWQWVYAWYSEYCWHDIVTTLVHNCNMYKKQSICQIQLSTEFSKWKNILIHLSKYTNTIVVHEAEMHLWLAWVCNFAAHYYMAWYLDISVSARCELKNVFSILDITIEL